MLMSARDKESGAPMSDGELIDEMLTLIVAGHETTASGLNWTWYLLSQHPEAEAQLHAELDAAPRTAGAVAGADGGARRTRSRSSTRHCVCTRPGGCCRAARSRRTCSAATRCRPRTNVLVPLYLVHRHPRFWKDPDAF